MFGASALVLVCAVLAVYALQEQRNPVSRCAALFDGDRELSCIFDYIERRMRDDGLPAAFRAFSEAYRISEPFEAYGCHRQAHTVGDLFFALFRERQLRMEDVAFPAEATACGFGFLHGFFEHLVQDEPDPIRIADICREFAASFPTAKKTALETCFHGGGHGFMLAQAERVPHAEWGNIASFTDGPLRSCALLPEDVPRDVRDECIRGVLTVLIVWMAEEEYGFSFNTAEPFGFCDRWSGTTRSRCYSEAALYAGLFAPSGVREFAGVVEASIPDAAMRAAIFETGMVGLVQGTIRNGRYLQMLEGCARLSANMQRLCVESIVHGLFEHGEPRKEHVVALAFCQSERVAELGHASACLEKLFAMLPRFHSPEESISVCEAMQNPLRASCLERAAR